MRFFLKTRQSSAFSRMQEKQDLQEFSSGYELYASKPLMTYRYDGDLVFVLGNIIGMRNKEAKIESNPAVDELREALATQDRNSEIEGRFTVLRFNKNTGVNIWSDQFAGVDIYYSEFKDTITVASGLDLFPSIFDGSRQIDDVAVMQAMYIYGGRPAKKQTWYKDIKRLGPLESLNFKGNEKLSVSKIKRPSRKRYNYNSSNALNLYSDAFFEAVRARASSSGNIVLLSSGWDSTSILATLVHLFDKSKIRAVIGQMKYSDRSGVCNQFELNRATAIAEYFGIQLDIVDLDYRTGVSTLTDKLSGIFKAQQFANLTGFNHWILSEYVSSISQGGETVFAGEISDGAHNFGFSQYASIFHPFSHEFREYGDKMATYLFGPTFLKVLLDNKQDDDPVWNLFRSLKPNLHFQELAADEESRKLQFLQSFFLRSGRMPLAGHNTKLLTPQGREEFDEVSSDIYLKEKAANLTSENLYETYLDLYHSFHWQGATVAVLDHTLEANGLTGALPFKDSELLNFLSQMPEDWGRGLELKPTKYPLKWMLENKLDYPMELQKGPHSYTYDVDRNFTHLGELVNRSALSGLFKDNLKQRNYEAFLSDTYFDLDYVDQLVKKYCSDIEIIGAEQIDLANLALLGLFGPTKATS